MPLSPIPEENENSPRMPFQNGMKKTKNTNTYKYLQSHHPGNRALASTLRVGTPYKPSKATRKAAKKTRQAAAKAAKAAKKRTRKNRR